jgi:pseudouridine synthase
MGVAMREEHGEHLEALLEAHRRRLRVLEEQVAKFGAHSPAHVQVEIDDAKTRIAQIEEELHNLVQQRTPTQPTVPDQSVISPSQLEQLRQQARKAYFRKDWEQAVKLFAEYLAHDPTDEEIQSNLTGARRNLRLQRDYQAIREMRDEGLWREVLDALGELERQLPSYPDHEGLRAWAKDRQYRERLYKEALAASNQRAWRTAIDKLETLLDKFPTDDEAATLLAHVRTQSDQQRRDQLYNEALAASNQRAWRTAINKLETLLGEFPTDDEAATLLAHVQNQTVERTYVMLHKPAYVVSTADDPQGRPTSLELIDLPVQLFPVSQLDYDSEGLLLLTGDGELSQRLTLPSYKVEKEYRALLDQTPTPDVLRDWRRGVVLAGSRTAPAWVDVLERNEIGSWVRVVLYEGDKCQIRAVASQLGYNVLRLIRVREGPLTLGDLPAGVWRQLTDEEVELLWQHVGGS